MAGYHRKATPNIVERHLRQEAGFGCAMCGHPYVEYHHIIPYAEDPHFREEDMVAVCGNCHRIFARLSQEKQYQIKDSPHNKKNGLVKGALFYDKKDISFRVGGNDFVNCPTMIRFYSHDLISARVENEEVKVSLRIYNRDFQKIFEVVDNIIQFRQDDFWDFEYKINYAVLRSGFRNVALKMDFRNDQAIIEGRFPILGQDIILDSEEASIPGISARGSSIVNCPVGIQVGDPQFKITPGNVLQKHMRPTISRIV